MSRRRPYLNIKASILDLFRTTARWLKDTTSRESIFEKPYINPDYRAMHLNIPEPDWPSSNIEGGNIPKRPKTHTFVWDPGICTLGVASPECGEEFDLGVSIGLLPPGSMMKSIEWSASSSDEDCIAVIGTTSGISGKIHLKASNDCAKTVSICVTGKLVGSIRDTLKVPSPFDKTGILDYREAASIPALVDTTKETGYVYNCGCTDIELNCQCEEGSSDMTYDWDTSAETIGKNDSAVVTIIDAGAGSPYTWSISGTGFYVDVGRTKKIRETVLTSIVIYTSSAGCGSGIITVTACDGETVTGSIRCTEGVWVLGDTCQTADRCMGFYVCGASGCWGTIGEMKYADSWCVQALSSQCHICYCYGNECTPHDAWCGESVGCCCRATAECNWVCSLNGGTPCHF